MIPLIFHYSQSSQSSWIQFIQLAQLLLQLDDKQNDIVVQHQHQQVIRQRRPRWQRRWSCKSWLLRRTGFGQFEHLMLELAAENPAGFQSFVRCEPTMFQEMVERLTSIISKQDTNYRKALDPGLKVAITLHYMATGDCSIVDNAKEIAVALTQFFF